MKITFKYIIPSLILISAILIISEKSSYLIGTIALFLIGPIAIIYMTSVFIRELNKRERNDNTSMRSLIIITSLLSAISILILLFSAVFQLDYQGLIKTITFGLVILSLVTSLIYFLFNYNKFDFYITTEFIIVLAPCLLLIGIYALSSRVPKETFINIANNSKISLDNNNFIEDNFEFDDATTNSLKILTQIENELIDLSGGYLQNGELVSGTSRDYFSTLIFRQKRIDSIEKALSDINISISDIEWLDIDEAPHITVADAVLKFELLKNRILIEKIRKTVPNNGEHP